MMSKLDRLCRKYRITADSVYGAAEPWPAAWRNQPCHPWTVTLSWRGKDGRGKPRVLTVSHFQGPDLEHDPTAADVLYGLLVDAAVEDYSSLEDWAEDLGHDLTDTRTLPTYQECLRLAPRVRAFLGNDDELIAEFREAEH